MGQRLAEVRKSSPPTSGQIALILKYGSVAQMVERALSMREARGSMPLSSNVVVILYADVV